LLHCLRFELLDVLRDSNPTSMGFSRHLLLHCADLLGSRLLARLGWSWGSLHLGLVVLGVGIVEVGCGGGQQTCPRNKLKPDRVSRDRVRAHENSESS
jgi:hypothetical protein